MLLFVACASPIYSQSDSVKIWITPAQEERVFQLYDDYKVLKIGYQFIFQENEQLRSENDSLKNEIDRILFQYRLELQRMEKQLNRDSAKISSLEKRIEYKDKVILTKAIENEKWRKGYYQNLKYRKEFVWNSLGKWSEIFGTAGIFGIVTYFAITLSK